MDRQNFIDELIKHGKSCPARNIEILAGEKVIEMVFYYEAALFRGIQVDEGKYYVFINDKGEIFECDSAESAVQSALSNKAFDYNSVEIGDYVDFGSYGQFYVCGENIDGTKFLVTNNPLQRAERPDAGFYLEKCYAKDIVEKYKL